MNPSTPKITPFFTLAGTSEEAMDFYITLFPNSKITNRTYFAKGDPGEEGKLMNGTFELAGQQFMVMDMQKEYIVPLSWATSLLVACADEAEFDALFAKVSPGGVIMMGPEPAGIMRKVAWITDKFGLTWQLVWE